MTTTALPAAGAAPGAGAAFRHEAFLYAGDEAFVAGAAAFLREGADRDEPAFVVVSAPKIGWLRDALGPDRAGAGDVWFADMAEIGANPARIIPAWHDFVASHAAPGRPLRGIGEPISAGRSPDELVECQRHESLLNLAFEGAPALWLVCPYDTSRLDAAVIEEACRSHPFVSHDVVGGGGASDRYRGLAAIAAPFDTPLPPPPRQAAVVEFGPGPLAAVRRFVARHAASAGLDRDRTADLELAVTELAANSLRHGGGDGVVRVWSEDRRLVCEVHDRGRIDAPLAGRHRPAVDRVGGRGMWLVNQLCDLVQVRSFADGTVVRVHLTVPGRR